MLVAGDLISEQSGRETLRAFHDHWAVVHEEIAKRMNKPVQTPEPAPQVAEPAPQAFADGGESDDVDFDEPFGNDVEEETAPQARAQGPQIVDLPDDVYLDAAGF
jgi:hypothetical protein